MTFKALFCGDRDWSDRKAHPDSWNHEYKLVGAIMRQMLDEHPDLEIIHGAARGADTCADLWALDYRLPIHAFPAYWNCGIYEDWTGTFCKVDGNHSVMHGISAGPIRNQLMIDENPDIVVAFHDNLKDSKGTKDMVFKAEARGIKTMIITNTH